MNAAEKIIREKLEEIDYENEQLVKEIDARKGFLQHSEKEKRDLLEALKIIQAARKESK